MKRLIYLLAFAGLGALPMFVAFHYASAYADTLNSDPLSTATSSITSGMDLITQYGWLWGAMIVVYGAGSYLLKQNDSQHWIAKGRNLSMVVSAATLLGAALQAHLAGTAWSGVLLTVIVAAFKLVNPLVTASTALALLFSIGPSPACGAAQIAAAKQFLACSETAAIKDLTTTAKNILSSGVLDWKGQLNALAAAYGKDAVNCAVLFAEQFFAAQTGGATGDGDAMARAAEYLADQGYAVK